MTPSDFDRRILICVTGLTPQVVTETTYALACGEPSWPATEVHVLTTRTGADRARRTLIDEGRFADLCRDLGLDDVRFGPDTLHVMHAADGSPLDDIRDQSDSTAMADAIMGTIASYTRDPDAALHVSLAGGRKSMGFFAGYALSLYGRVQDRLSHVLVSADFESNPAFFYPPAQPQVMQTRDGRSIDTRDAKVELADIPFVRMRDRLPDELLRGGRFADAIAAAQRLEAPPQLEVDISARRLVCAGQTVQLSGQNFAIYAWHAWRAAHLASPEVRLVEFNAIDSALRAELARFGERVHPNEYSSDGGRWRDRDWQDPGTDHAQWLSERRSRINATLARTLGEAGVQRYGIAQRQIQGRSSCHLLDLSADCIAIRD